VKRSPEEFFSLLSPIEFFPDGMRDDDAVAHQPHQK
jgi:hypothetical protein